MEADGIDRLAGVGLEVSLWKEGRDLFCLLWSGRQECPESLRVHLAASERLLSIRIWAVRSSFMGLDQALRILMGPHKGLALV